MKSRLLGGIAALVLAVVGTVLLVGYVQNADTRAQAGLEPEQVLVVQKPVPAGTSVDGLGGYVGAEAIPAAAVPAGAVKSLDGFAGKVTAVNLLPGEQLLDARLVDPSALVTAGSVPVPDGMQEVTVQLAPERVLGGRLQAGDTVGIFVSYDKGADPAKPDEPVTRSLFHKVLVTGIQQAPAKSGANEAQAVPDGTVFVTFARDTADAAQIVHAVEFGTLWLSHESASSADGGPVTVLKNEVH